MAIDITNVLDALQRKINSFDSSGDTFDLQYLLSGALRADRSSTIVYDTLNDLPDLTIDSDFAGQENMVYLKDQENIYFKDYTNRKWKPLSIPLFYNVGYNYGFSVGGEPPGTASTVTDKFPFSAPFTTATNVGDFNPTTGAKRGGAMNSFTEGFIYSGTSTPDTTVQKFNMVNFTGASTHITIPAKVVSTAACSDLNEYKGYVIGGALVQGNPAVTTDEIYQFDFASSTPRVLVGNAAAGIYRITGVSSALKGYWGGGFPGFSTISEFPYSSSTIVSEIGNINPTPSLPALQQDVMGNSSKEYGYFSGGIRKPSPSAYTTQIEKFSFSIPGNSVVMGDLTVARSLGSGSNSETEGYDAGGLSLPGVSNVIDKFPFATDTNAVDAGDLTVTKQFSHGFNY